MTIKLFIPRAKTAEEEMTDVVESLRPTIPLDRALLCVECENISTAQGCEGCPSCGSRELWPLGRVLNRKVEAAYG
jgi:hypothetical protein